MPESTTLVCKTCLEWSTVCHGNSGTYLITWCKQEAFPYRYHYTCTCKGYRFRGTCHHISDAARFRCGWNSEKRPVFAQKQCPVCGVELVEVPTC